MTSGSVLYGDLLQVCPLPKASQTEKLSQMKSGAKLTKTEYSESRGREDRVGSLAHITLALRILPIAW